jgi:8-oxo-dGTP diphosphatase
MSNNPFPSDRIVSGSLVYALCEGAEDRYVLLLKRERMPHQGLWSPPGGKMDIGESPEECAVREMYEETGLTISQPVLRGIVTVYDMAYPIHWLLFIFRAQIAQANGSIPAPISASVEGELRWIPLTELEHYERPYTDASYFPRVIDDSPLFQRKFVFDTPLKLVSEAEYS